MNTVGRYWINFAAGMTAFGFLVKILLGVNLVDFGLIISGWMLLGRLITVDDELPGAFHNPNGDETFPKLELLGIASVFGVFVLLKMMLAAL